VFGVQLCAASGANAIAVISDESKRDYVMSLGAKSTSLPLPVMSQIALPNFRASLSQVLYSGLLTVGS
jgi:D-arabinose 1-dehydrogenase-like Zn-dependent alcohol dehydrogenase